MYQSPPMPSMPSVVKILRVVADPNRLRILLLLDGEELSVAELQEILTMGQSTLSTHLSQLRQAGLVEDRRTGKNILYRLAIQPPTERTLPPANTAPTQAEAWKGHGFRPADTAESNELKGTGFSPYINDAEKGHDFRPADTAESNEL